MGVVCFQNSDPQEANQIRSTFAEIYSFKATTLIFKCDKTYKDATQTFKGLAEIQSCLLPMRRCDVRARGEVHGVGQVVLECDVEVRYESTHGGVGVHQQVERGGESGRVGLECLHVHRLKENEGRKWGKGEGGVALCFVVLTIILTGQRLMHCQDVF